MLQELAPDQFEERIHSEDVFLLDVRTKEEFEHGHLKGATLIPVQELRNRLKEIEEFKNLTILIYCRSGVRSINAGEILLASDFRSVAHLTPGITGWIMAEKKVVI